LSFIGAILTILFVKVPARYLWLTGSQFGQPRSLRLGNLLKPF